MSFETLSDAADIIDALGGKSAVAALTGAANANAVGNWERAGEFPARTFLVMTEALRKIGRAAPASLWKQVEPEQAA